MLYDLFLLVAVLMLATVPFVVARGGELVEPADNALYQLTLFAVIFAYYVGYWSWRGRTLGMQSWGLQLETQEGKVPRVGANSLRFAVALVSFAPAGLGFWWQLWDPEGLAWHDRLSRTRLKYYPRGKV